MARTTKLELEQLLAARNEELVAARTRISILEAELEAARKAKPAHPARRTLPERSAEPTEFQIACQRARELAMKTGRSVLVG